MVSCDTCFLTLGLVSAFLVVSMDARSWDIAVAIGERIDFLNKNGTEVGQSRVRGAERFTGLAYDNVTKTMYVSDTKNKNFSTYSSTLARKASDPYTALKQINGQLIMAMVFDPVDRILFWTDHKNNTIMKMKVSLNGTTSDPEVLHDLEDQSPYGIAIDICNRYIFWSNFGKHDVVNIERSKLDGTDRQTIVNGSLREVYGLAIDHYAGKLYWVDDVDGIKYNIERSNIDGKERALFINGTHNEPLYIAVDNEAVYWTDREYGAVWKKAKIEQPQVEPSKFKSYDFETHPTGIITWDNTGNIDCDAISKAQKNQIQNSITTEKPQVQSLDEPTSTIEKINSTTTRLEKQCSNDGRYDESTATCICKEGFSGPLCEVLSVCHNYCVHGSCVVDAKGLPKCDCGISHAGERCEKDVCDGYCLNDGICSVSSAGPTCKCENFEGPRCEYTSELDKLCSLYCTQNEEVPSSVSAVFCKCSEHNETWSQHLMATEPLVSSTIILSVLISLVGTLTIVVGVLSYHVHKLRRRPRIRKRFVVSKSGVTPLTSRPQVPSDSCEITIENCCNMNICETPCFEPKLRTTTPTKSSSTKAEEKNSLLDSMEGADSC